MNNDEKGQVDIARGVRQLKENLPALLEMETLKAQIAYARFKSLQIVGFTEYEALRIVIGGYQS